MNQVYPEPFLLEFQKYYIQVLKKRFLKQQEKQVALTLEQFLQHQIKKENKEMKLLMWFCVVCAPLLCFIVMFVLLKNTILQATLFALINLVLDYVIFHFFSKVPRYKLRILNHLLNSGDLVSFDTAYLFDEYSQEYKKRKEYIEELFCRFLISTFVFAVIVLLVEHFFTGPIISNNVYLEHLYWLVWCFFFFWKGMYLPRKTTVMWSIIGIILVVINFISVMTR